VELSANGGGGLAPYTYDWGNAGDGQTISVAPFSTTTYTVTVTDACGETANAQAQVVVNQWDPNITAITDTICGGGSGFIGPITGGTGIYVSIYSDPEGFSFNPNEPGVVGAPSVTGETPFTIFIVDECGNTGSVPVIVKPCETIVPNIITPNDDDVNDGFTIFGLENFPNSELLIYNRWGNLIYEEANYSNIDAWDGEGHSDGVYFWILRRSDGTEYQGTVVLKRE
jgi:gliding motility-associated-like protein